MRAVALVWLSVSILGFGCGGDDAGGGDEPIDAGDTGGSGGSGGSGGGTGGSGGGMAPTDMPDAGADTGASDPCAAVTAPCASAGAVCEGETLVSCVMNADGCLVETSVDCTQNATDFCDETADPPRCIVDPCTLVTNPCTMAGVDCTGDTLVTCAADSNGCLVETETDCTQGSTDFCDESLATPACAVDPCALVANPCTAAGVTCDAETLVTCAADGDGCLVATRMDCTQGNTDYCDEAATTPVCAACSALPNTCSAASTACNGETLETCSADANGCLVTTTQDCTQGNTDFCDEDATTPACVSCTIKDRHCAVDETTCAEDFLVVCVPDADLCPIATPAACTTIMTCGDGDDPCNVCDNTVDPPACDYDPCKGVTNCLTPGATCRGTDIVTCAATVPDGCLVESVQDCTVGGTVNETCDPNAGAPRCAACFDDAGCEDPTASGDKFCTAGDVHQTCIDTDGDSCLNLVEEPCGTDFTCNVANGCEYTGGDVCSSAVTDTLRANESLGPFNTSGAGNDYSSYPCPGLSSLFPFAASAPDLLFALEVPPDTVINVRLTNPTGFTNRPYLVQIGECADGSASAESTCAALSSSELSSANESAATARVYLVVDADGASNVGMFGLEITTRPLECGDGHIDGSEQCDDGNVFSDDGCTTACVPETGYECTGNSPSVCTRRPTDRVCGNVVCDPLPGGAPQGTELCCTATQACGIAYPLVYGAGCMQRDQQGVDDPACPDEQSTFLFPTLAGCCRSDNKCGLTAGVGLGCVERTETWTNMQDGYGVFLYTGPFAAVACTYPP